VSAAVPATPDSWSREVLETLPLALVVAEGRELTVAYANPAAARLAGRPREALVGAPLAEVLPDDALLDGHRRVLQTGLPFVGHSALEASNGAALRGIVETEAVGFGTGVLTTLRDVTARVHAERRLRDSRTQLAEAQRVAHFGSWEWDMRTGEVTWSDELYRIYGVSPVEYRPSYEAYLGRVHAEDRDRVGATIRTAATSGRPFTFEERVVRPDGTVRILESGGGVIAGDDGTPVRMVGACHDVTERENARERLAEARAELERRRVAERHARRINDGIIGSLVEGVHALDDGDVRGAQRAMRTTLEHASAIVTELVGPVTA
jgi:PAS domain S-box-containing protein